MIERLFTTNLTVSRPVWTGDSAINTVTGTFGGHMQQARAELAQQLGYAMTKTFIIWCPIGTDVQEGDSLTDGTNTFSVRGVQVNNNGANPHKELTVEKNE
jgi:hypothetical protein